MHTLNTNKYCTYDARAIKALLESRSWSRRSNIDLENTPIILRICETFFKSINTRVACRDAFPTV